MDANIIGVEMDEDCIIIEDLEEKIKRHHPKLLYTTPHLPKPNWPQPQPGAAPINRRISCALRYGGAGGRSPMVTSASAAKHCRRSRAFDTSAMAHHASILSLQDHRPWSARRRSDRQKEWVQN